MKYSELPYSIRRLARRNERKYWKGVGLFKARKTLSSREILIHMFSFAETKEGEEFWHACEHFENMEQLSSTQVYKDFIKKRRDRYLYNFYFILSLLLYTALGIFLYRKFVPADFISKFFIR